MKRPAIGKMETRKGLENTLHLFILKLRDEKGLGKGHVVAERQNCSQTLSFSFVFNFHVLFIEFPPR